MPLVLSCWFTHQPANLSPKSYPSVLSPLLFIWSLLFQPTNHHHQALSSLTRLAIYSKSSSLHKHMLKGLRKTNLSRSSSFHWTSSVYSLQSWFPESSRWRTMKWQISPMWWSWGPWSPGRFEDSTCIIQDTTQRFWCQCKAISHPWEQFGIFLQALHSGFKQVSQMQTELHPEHFTMDSINHPVGAYKQLNLGVPSWWKYPCILLNLK